MERINIPRLVPRNTRSPLRDIRMEFSVGWVAVPPDGVIVGIVIAVPAVFVEVSIGTTEVAVVPVAYTVVAEVPLTFSVKALL